MSPLINWEEIQNQIRPPVNRAGSKSGPGHYFNVEKNARMYNMIAKLGTKRAWNQVNAFDTSENDTVLDIGCGPGRLAVLMAQKAKSVTALDSSTLMLEHCRRNAEAAGVTNLKTIMMDWEDAELGKNIEQHDIVIASRSLPVRELKRVAGFAKKYVVFVGWANAPHVPVMIGTLFEGVEGGWQLPAMNLMNREIGLNFNFNMIYDMGYDPNIRIVEDGLVYDYASKEEAYEDIWTFDDLPGPIPDVFKRNVDRWLTENDNGGVTFSLDTRSYVIWFEPHRQKQWWEQ